MPTFSSEFGFKDFLVLFLQKNLSIVQLFALIFKMCRLISFLAASNFQIGRTFLLLISKILFILAPSLIFFCFVYFLSFDIVYDSCITLSRFTRYCS